MSTLSATSARGSLYERLHAFRGRYAKAEIAVFFAAGFLFDVVTLDRIDSTFSILQQTAYLLILMMLLLYEQRHGLGLSKQPELVAKVWRFSEDALHFLLGSLLSAFSLFYFKSASGLVSLMFLVVMFAVLVANELPFFRKQGHLLRLGLFAVCVTSYFSYLVPMAFGFLSVWLFLLAVGLATLIGLLMFSMVRRWSKSTSFALRQVGLPYLGVQVLLVGLYFARAIPPIPLSVQQIGIYHGVEKAGAKYKLIHQKPKWKFWQSGDQNFAARPGDRAFMFARVFAPRRFQDRVKVQWMYDDAKRGWRDHGPPIPLKIGGGRDQGFRTFAFVTDPAAGDWKVKLLTEDDRVIGSTSFSVQEDEGTEPRVFTEDDE